MYGIKNLMFARFLGYRPCGTVRTRRYIQFSVIRKTFGNILETTVEIFWNAVQTNFSENLYI